MGKAESWRFGRQEIAGGADEAIGPDAQAVVKHSLASVFNELGISAQELEALHGKGIV